MDNLITRLFRRRIADPFAWFRITFDGTAFHLDVAPPKGTPWQDTVPWDSIKRVVFEATDFLVSDDIYIFASDRPESRRIPMEAPGGDALWNELLRRGLFPYDLAIRAMGSPEGFFIWPDPATDS